MWQGLQTAQAMREQLLKARDFEGYLRRFDGHKRFAPFLEMHEQMPDADYWKCLALVWDNIEVSFPDRKAWLALFESSRPHRDCLMTRGEQKTLARFPDVLTVFRGYAKGIGRGGLSWTLSEAVALHFARYATGSRRAFLCGHKMSAAKMIIAGQCSKRDVLAYFNGREEMEIIVRPGKVFAKRSRET